MRAYEIVIAKRAKQREVSIKTLNTPRGPWIYAGAVVAVCLAGAIDAAAQQWTPSPPKNLKVMAADTDIRSVITAMKGFTQALGVRCEHSHAYKGTNPNDLAAFDFASDEKTTKVTARTMMRMTHAINSDFLKDVGKARPAGETKVGCYTCHHGEPMPLSRRPDPPK